VAANSSTLLQSRSIGRHSTPPLINNYDSLAVVSRFRLRPRWPQVDPNGAAALGTTRRRVPRRRSPFGAPASGPKLSSRPGSTLTRSTREGAGRAEAAPHTLCAANTRAQPARGLSPARRNYPGGVASRIQTLPGALTAGRTTVGLFAAPSGSLEWSAGEVEGHKGRLGHSLGPGLVFGGAGRPALIVFPLDCYRFSISLRSLSGAQNY